MHSRHGAQRCAFGASAALALCLGFVAACSSDASPGNTAAAGSVGQAGTLATGGAGGGSGGAASGGGGASTTLGGSSASAGTAGGSSGAGSGGAGGSAGSAAAGASGSAGSAGAAACVTSGTELCDDFESGMLDAQRWTQNKSNMTQIAVETGRAHSGQYAVHLKFVA